MKATDLIMYIPLFVDGNDVETLGVPQRITIQELIDLVDTEAGSVTVSEITDAGTAGAAILLADTEAEAQAAAGGTSVGIALFTATTEAEAQGAAGGTPVGIELFTAASESAARTALELGSGYAANMVANIGAEGGDFANLTAVTTAWNGLLSALKTAGVMTAD